MDIDKVILDLELALNTLQSRQKGGLHKYENDFDSLHLRKQIDNEFACLLALEGAIFYEIRIKDIDEEIVNEIIHADKENIREKLNYCNSPINQKIYLMFYEKNGKYGKDINKAIDKHNNFINFLIKEKKMSKDIYHGFLNEMEKFEPKKNIQEMDFINENIEPMAEKILNIYEPITNVNFLMVDPIYKSTIMEASNIFNSIIERLKVLKNIERSTIQDRFETKKNEAANLRSDVKYAKDFFEAKLLPIVSDFDLNSQLTLDEESKQKIMSGKKDAKVVEDDLEKDLNILEQIGRVGKEYSGTLKNIVEVAKIIALLSI